MRRKDATQPDCLVKNIMGYSSFECESVRWGRTHEAAARRVYTKTQSANHPGLCVSECGLCVSSCTPHLGASPDGLVYCAHCVDKAGVLEIKCPYKFREKTPLDAAKEKSFCSEIVDGSLKLKRNHAYYYQVQGQMAICGRKWCDFFIWTLKGSSVERIQFDEDLWILSLQKLYTFYVTAIVPELFTERVKRGVRLYRAK
jgi:hypothetical protein